MAPSADDYQQWLECWWMAYKATNMVQCIEELMRIKGYILENATQHDEVDFDIRFTETDGDNVRMQVGFTVNIDLSEELAKARKSKSKSKKKKKKKNTNKTVTMDENPVEG
jgi:hypothetical protein